MPQIELVTRASVVSTDWWGVLSSSEQRAMLIETQALTEEMVKFGLSRLAIGEHLLNIRSVLEPKRKFVNFLKTQCRFSKATAYRYIETYVRVRDNVPDLVLRTAIARGYDVIDMTMIQKLPPPKTQDRTKIVKYLEKIEEARRVERSASQESDFLYDSDTLMREALNFVTMRFGRLPDDKKVRARWLNRLIGLMLSDLGAKEEQAFIPIDVPEEFRVTRKRPRMISAA
jgi:hypothetical protein